MICSSNGVKLLSSHLIPDACISIYEGVFQRTLNSGIWTLSRVIGGRVGGHRDGTVNLNNSSVLPNTSIRGSVSLSRADYERKPFTYYPSKPVKPIDGVSEADFQKGFEDWCNCYEKFKFFSSEGEKDYMFKWFCDNYPYGRHFRFGGRPDDELIDYARKYGNKIVSKASLEMLEKSRQARASPRDDDEDPVEVHYSNKLSWDELDEYQAKRCSGRYIGRDRLADIEPDT